MYNEKRGVKVVLRLCKMGVPRGKRVFGFKILIRSIDSLLITIRNDQTCEITCNTQNATC